MSFMKVVILIVMLPFVLLSRSFWWQAAYCSAGVTQKQIDDLELAKKEIPDWLLEISPKQRATRGLLAVCRMYALPLYLAMIFAGVNCFTKAWDGILDLIITYLPLGIICFALVGAMLARYFKAQG